MKKKSLSRDGKRGPLPGTCAKHTGGAVFNRYAARYDRWYGRYPCAFRSELAAVRKAVPEHGRGLEIGVGTGRFALALGITDGIEPSAAMRAIARRRGVRVHPGTGEELPFRSGTFAYVALVTTLCFTADPARVLHEAWRVLKPQGAVILAIIDRDSALGRRYRRQKSIFFRHAHLFSVDEARQLLRGAGFNNLRMWQTLSRRPEDMRADERPRRGSGTGGFVVVRALKR